MIRPSLELLQKETSASPFLALIPEDSLIRQVIREDLIARTFSDTNEALINLDERSGIDTSLMDIRGFLAESPLFGTKRLIWIEQADKIDDLSKESVSRLLKEGNTQPRSLIVLEVKEKLGDELSKIIPVFRMGWSKVSAQKDQEFSGWILTLGKKRGLSVTQEASTILQHHFEAHLGMIDQWLKKTASSLEGEMPDKQKPLVSRDFLLHSEEKIEDPLQTVFHLFSGWEEHDERILRDWRRFSGKSGSPLGILSLWHRQWRLYTLGNLLASDPDGTETLTRTEKLSPYRARKIMETSKKLTRSTLQKGYALLTQTDLLMKSGTNGEVAMDRLLLALWVLSPNRQKPTNQPGVRKVR